MAKKKATASAPADAGPVRVLKAEPSGQWSVRLHLSDGRFVRVCPFVEGADPETRTAERDRLCAALVDTSARAA